MMRSNLALVSYGVFMLFHMVALNLLLKVALITAYYEDFGWLLEEF